MFIRSNHTKHACTNSLRLLQVVLALSCVAALSIAPATASAATAPSLPTGAWAMTANGSSGALAITSIDASGNLSGTALGIPIKGFWDGFARRITFETNKASIDLRVYTAYLYSSTTIYREQTTYTLAGSFEALAGSGGKAQRSVFGWTAELISTAAVGTVTSSDPYVALPSPSTWVINANGFEGELAIKSVDAAGNVSGDLFGDPVQGFWDGFEQRLSIVRFGSLADATILQIYTGYLYSQPHVTGPLFGGQFSLPALAGSFEAFTGTGATARRNVFGWNAEQAP